MDGIPTATRCGSLRPTEVQTASGSEHGTAARSTTNLCFCRGKEEKTKRQGWLFTYRHTLQHEKKHNPQTSLDSKFRTKEEIKFDKEGTKTPVPPSVVGHLQDQHHFPHR